MIFVDYIRDTVKASTDSIKKFKEQPLKSLGQLLPISMLITVLISLVTDIIIFIFQGGYTKHIGLIKESFFGSLKKGFTIAPTSNLLLTISLIFLGALFFANYVIMLISFFKTEKKGKKISVSVFLSLLILSLLLLGFYAAVYNKTFNFAKLYKFIITSNSPIVFYAPLGLLISGLVFFIITGIFLYFTEHKWMLKATYDAIKYILLALLAAVLIKNILMLIIGIILILVIAVAFWFIKAMLSDSSDSSVSSSKPSSSGGFSGFASSGGSSSSSKAKSDEIKAVEKKTSIFGTEEKKQKVVEVRKNALIWRDKGGLVTLFSTGDTLYTKDSFGLIVYLCLVNEYERGDVVIMQDGARVLNIAGCKTPKK